MIAPMLPLFFPSGLMQPALMSCVIFRVVSQTEYAAPAGLTKNYVSSSGFTMPFQITFVTLFQFNPIHLTCGIRSRIKNLEGVIRLHIEPKILERSLDHGLF